MARQGCRCDHARMVDRTEGLEQMSAARRERLILLARVISILTVLGALSGLWLSTIDQQHHENEQTHQSPHDQVPLLPSAI